MSRPLGYVLYEGPSLLDSSPIIAIATGFDVSQNRKTGDMIQTWILAAGRKPTEALKLGEDASVCGSCPLRGDGTGKDRACYVNLGQGPRSVWEAWQRGRYLPLAGNPFNDRLVRLGAYGDPAAVPRSVWDTVLAQAAGHTGYTHQWRTCDQSLRELVMASVETESDATQAHAAGWRTFRVKHQSAGKVRGEAACPAAEESGHKLSCFECLACCGTASGRRGSIVINAHGSSAARAGYTATYGASP